MVLADLCDVRVHRWGSDSGTRHLAVPETFKYGKWEQQASLKRPETCMGMNLRLDIIGVLTAHELAMLLLQLLLD